LKEILPPKYESTWKHKNKSGLQSPFLLTRLVHVWTAPSVQDFSAVMCKVVACSHVFGLLMQRYRLLALMESADWAQSLSQDETPVPVRV
jgi:hypothetical protein